MVIESNGKRTEVRFRGTLLVPVDVWPGSLGNGIWWFGSLQSSDTKVDVIAFNATNRDEFAPMLQTDLAALRKQEPTDNVLGQISFIEGTLREMASPAFVKTPEPPLLDAASRLVSDSMKQMGTDVSPRFEVENTIYVAGISAMYNI